MSAVCESIERWSGRSQGNETDRVASHADLVASGTRAVHPRDLLHFSERQYADREAWNAAHSDFAWVPHRFDDDWPIGWTTAWSLTRDEPVLVPTAYAFYNVVMEAGHVFCSADSNGSAAGNTLTEAVLQGFLELVERDAVAIWWYNRLSMPALDLDAVDDAVLQAVRADYAASNRALWVLEVTGDLRIPTYVAVSPRLDRREEIVQGYGAHLDPRIALWRAISEASQMLGHLEGVDLTTLSDPDLAAWYADARIADHPYLAPGPLVGLPAGTAGGSLREVAADALGRAEAVGLEVLVVDQSREDVPLHVAKVIVPGLRHFWPRLGPGRLYDVPVREGLLPAPRAEADLNPVPITT